MQQFFVLVSSAGSEKVTTRSGAVSQQEQSLMSGYHGQECNSISETQCGRGYLAQISKTSVITPFHFSNEVGPVQC